MKTLKDNKVYMWAYETILDVIDRVPYFIEEVYNKKRLHSSWGMYHQNSLKNRLEWIVKLTTETAEPLLLSKPHRLQ